MSGKIGKDLDELRRLFGIVGSLGGPDALRADEGVQLMFDVGRLVGGNFAGADPGGIPAMSYNLLNASVGNTNRFQLRNPSDSTRMLVLEEIWMRTGAASNSLAIRIVDAAADLATAATERNRDLGLAIPLVGVVSTDQSAAAFPGTVFTRWVTSTVGMERIPLRLRIPPGMAIHWNNEVANITCDTTVFWREI